MPRKHRAKVSSFGSRLFEFWRRALNERIAIPVATHQEAVRLRFRLYELRSAMREEEHPAVEAANRVTLRIYARPDGTYKVVGEPGDSEFDEALTAGGITVPDAPPLDESMFTLDAKEEPE